MQSKELERLFASLHVPPGTCMSARQLPGLPRFRVAKQSDGAPAFLISIPENAPEAFGCRLANLLYSPREMVSVEGQGGEMHVGHFSVISCRAADGDLGHYFFRVVSTVVDELGQDPHVLAVDKAVESVIELFRALERPGRLSTQGVWAELLLLVHSQDPARAISAWHSDPLELHDFSIGIDRLEVKSTVKPIREHQFRLEQLSTQTNGTVLVASLMLIPSPNGATVSDLVEQLHLRVPAESELRSRVEAILAKGLGADWREIATTRFDAKASISSLRVFDAVSVPMVEPQVPAEVSNVNFTSDLTAVVFLEKQAIATRCPSLVGLLPR